MARRSSSERRAVELGAGGSRGRREASESERGEEGDGDEETVE